MKHLHKAIVVVLCLVPLMAVSTVSLAAPRGGARVSAGYSSHGHGNGAGLIFGLGMGALIGHILTVNRAPQRPAVVTYGQPCHVVHRLGHDTYGRHVKFAAVMCYDTRNRGYILSGSQHIIEYM